MRNQAWLQPWEPTSPMSWPERNSVGTWNVLLGNLKRAARAGTALPFVVVYGGRLVGQMNVSNVVHGALRSANIGYWVDSAVAGRGITPTALALAIDHCFSSVRLHRVEVDIRPENGPSLRVVQKLEMRQEGFYQRFLDIDNGWRDHLAFAVTTEELRGSTMLSRLPTLPPPPG
jgi:ribosomal-protein-alanine N-acetyltransferase